MPQRYVRVKTTQGNIHYGSLNLNRSVAVFDTAPWDGGQPSGVVLKADSYQFVAPCFPSKIIAVGRNYKAHAEELGNTVPTEPLLFLKPPSTLIGEEQPIYYPSQSQQVDYEGELALVIGEVTKNCSEKEAQSKIWGYTIANDVTARDFQRKDNQWVRAKGFDTFCPLGPWVIRELSAAASIQTFVNNEEEPRQSALVQDMIFSPQVIVSYISQILTLFPGDVILTGTPEGVGPVSIGDRIRVEIEGIGSIENPVMSEPTANMTTSEPENKQPQKS